MEIVHFLLTCFVLAASDVCQEKNGGLHIRRAGSDTFIIRHRLTANQPNLTTVRASNWQSLSTWFVRRNLAL